MAIKLGVVGGGAMGEAIVSRLLAQGIYQPQEILVSDRSPVRQQLLERTYGVCVTAENSQVKAATAILLAVKPQIFSSVAPELAQGLPSPSPLVISILAGTPLKTLQAALPHSPIVRAMPNTPATVGAGMTALAAGEGVESHHLAIVQQIFQAIGEAIEVPESYMDAVTALSGSGPGYVAVAIEALIDGGVAVGLPRTIATQLALQTVKGTVELLQTADLHPAVLKDRVTSPGGTTIAGIAALEGNGFRAALIEAVRAAYARSVELGQ